MIGTGYVGLVTAACFAELGSEVWCIDIDAEKIERLQRGEVPIHEPGLDEMLREHAARLHFSTDIADALANARLLFVAVGTPPTSPATPTCRPCTPSSTSCPPLPSMRWS